MAEEKTDKAENKGIQGDTQTESPRFSTKEGQKPADTVGTKPALEALKKDKPDIADRQDLENLANLERPTISPDKWKGSGSLQINGDYLSYLPEIKRRENPLAPGSMEKRVERGLKLAVVPDPEVVDPEVAKMTELKKVPAPVLWAILEANPNSLDKKYKFESGIDSLETVKTVIYDSSGELREGDLGYSWDGVTVDKKTLVNMQQKTLEYLEAQVKNGEMPQTILDAARGILRYANNAPEDPHIKKLGTNQKTSGVSPGDPRVEQKWWKLFSTDKWSVKGQLGQDENYLFYQDEKLKRQNRQRRVTIADSDPEDQTGQKLVLTKTAWDILRRSSSPVPGYVDSFGIADASGFATQSCEKPVQDKKGRWKAEAKTLSADSQTLGQMQKLIRNYVEKQVANGRMEADILATVDGILKYKHGTLEPARYDGDKLVYRIKGKEKPVVIERPPTLIDKIRKETSSQENITQVEVTPDEVKRYLTSKKLPKGAQIKNLQLEFSGSNARLNGVIDVPIPVFGGKINFDLELANNPDGDEIVVKDYAVDTKSGQLRKRLDQLEHYLRNINGVITDDVNEQLTDVEVESIAITDNGTLSFGLKRRSPVTN